MWNCQCEAPRLKKKTVLLGAILRATVAFEFVLDSFFQGLCPAACKSPFAVVSVLFHCYIWRQAAKLHTALACGVDKHTTSLSKFEKHQSKMMKTRFSPIIAGNSRKVASYVESTVRGTTF